MIKKRFKLYPNPQGQVDMVDYVESEEKKYCCASAGIGLAVANGMQR